MDARDLAYTQVESEAKWVFANGVYPWTASDSERAVRDRRISEFTRRSVHDIEL